MFEEFQVRSEHIKLLPSSRVKAANEDLTEGSYIFNTISNLKDIVVMYQTPACYLWKQLDLQSPLLFHQLLNEINEIYSTVTLKTHTPTLCSIKTETWGKGNNYYTYIS